uniref:Hemicentin-1-like von Willebrand factor A domain-containing protein n=1 Tax=Chromera velia CCMP2878 TaxID=1169474 RepID=A0A0G4I8G3_9ALVE|eukprot:Cvel_11941.t1-p1 / transcript=Cvel_11941.t1 / gene=Cvel_11941 / organism=Chromera_velia_CCMP2878 / gene_product=hypothetical protein / transcript_product=hypothetical protein / location=Cvel_scaffold765:17989-18693(+) / protein_length=235 / sequence_SO=supercontig / SO=protein_coding / is_pseudo=false
MVMAAFTAAISVADRGSTVYFFSDASPKDAGEALSVENLAREKSIRIAFILTGTCPEDGGIPHESYKRLADQTDGCLVLDTPKGASIKLENFWAQDEKACAEKACAEKAEEDEEKEACQNTLDDGIFTWLWKMARRACSSLKVGKTLIWALVGGSAGVLAVGLSACQWVSTADLLHQPSGWLTPAKGSGTSSVKGSKATVAVRTAAQRPKIEDVYENKTSESPMSTAWSYVKDGC